jgi:hypothetical protein
MDQAISDTRDPVKPIHSVHVHQAAPRSSSALRAASDESLRPVADSAPTGLDAPEEKPQC